MKRATVPRDIFPLACRLTIRSYLIDSFNKIIQEGFEVKDMGFLTEELRDIADQFDEWIEKENNK